jgi:hypothetical protein
VRDQRQHRARGTLAGRRRSSTGSRDYVLGLRSCSSFEDAPPHRAPHHQGRHRLAGRTKPPRRQRGTLAVTETTLRLIQNLRGGDAAIFADVRACRVAVAAIVARRVEGPRPLPREAARQGRPSTRCARAVSASTRRRSAADHRGRRRASGLRRAAMEHVATSAPRPARSEVGGAGRRGAARSPLGMEWLLSPLHRPWRIQDLGDVVVPAGCW